MRVESQRKLFYQQSERDRVSFRGTWTLITQLQESIKRLQVELTSKQEASSILQAQLEGVTAKCSSLRQKIEKLEGKLGALSHLDFSFENISSLTNII